MEKGVHVDANITLLNRRTNVNKPNALTVSKKPTKQRATSAGQVALEKAKKPKMSAEKNTDIITGCSSNQLVLNDLPAELDLSTEVYICLKCSNFVAFDLPLIRAHKKNCPKPS